MSELSKLIETHSAHNQSLREENATMANKLNELLKEFESRESKIDMVSSLIFTENELTEQCSLADLARVPAEDAAL